MNYFKTTVSGISWATALKIIMRVIIMARLFFLARLGLLLPSDFGTFGVVSLALSLLEILTETGINAFLLQEKGNYLEYINTAWIISILRGILISILIILASPYISSFFHNSSSLSLLYLSALIPFVRGFINPAEVKFQKELNFNKEFVFRLILLIFESITILFVAFHTRSASSFVWGLLISAVAECGISFLFITPRPHFNWDFSRFMEIIHRGKWVTGFGIFDYIFTNGDNIVVGRLLGSSALGIYQNAYKLSTLPVTEVTDIVYKVTFPVYVHMSGNKTNLRRAVLNTSLILILLLFIIGLILYIFAGPLVMFLLGPNWTEAIPVVRVLAFLGFVRGSSHAFNALFMALEKQKLITFITLFSMLGLVFTIVPAVRYFGLVGAGYSAMFGSFLSVPISLYFTLRILNQLQP